MKYYVYVLRSQRDGKRYIGITSDIKRRVDQHNAGKVLSTKSRMPFQIERIEELDDRLSARKKEKYFKTAAGRRFLKKQNTCAGGGMPARPNDSSII